MGKATSLVELILKKWGAPAAGVAAAGQSDDADAGFITKGGKTLLEAWHGSPHKFDKFSMDAIGTGEGAQAYGHGLYFADSEDVARNYRDMLSATTEEMETAAWALGRMGNDREAAIKALETGKGLGMAGPQSLFDDAAKLLRDEADLSGPGALYRAEIDVTPESLLDWDKPLSEQSEAVQEALSDFMAEEAEYLKRYPNGGVGERLGSNVVSALDRREGGAAQASEALRGRGIKGIKYLDGNSRNSVTSWADGVDSSAYDPLSKGIAENYLESANNNVEKALAKLRDDAQASGARQYTDAATALEKGDLYPSATSNYVIFDDSLINIAERGNADPRLLAGIAGTTAAGLAAPMIKDSGMISAPRSETLFDLTMGARDLERRLEGSPASLLFPSGLVEYLETVNRREEDPNAMTRGMALLDVLPF